MVVVSLYHSPVVASQVVQSVRSSWIGSRDDPRVLVALESIPGQEMWVIGQVALEDLPRVRSVSIECDTGNRLRPTATAVATTTTCRGNKEKHHGQSKELTSKRPTATLQLPERNKMRRLHCVPPYFLLSFRKHVNPSLINLSKNQVPWSPTCLCGFVAKHMSKM